MRVIAILNRAAGNETVGDMWKEAKSFPGKTPVMEILEWAQEAAGEMGQLKRPIFFRGHIEIVVDQVAGDL